MTIKPSPGPTGVELGYAEITSDFTQTGAGGPTDVTGLSVTVEVGARPIKVIFDCDSFYSSSASGITTVSIREGSTTLAGRTTSLTADLAGGHREVRLNPSAGSHTYKISVTQVITGNGKISATATSPAFIQVVEV